MWFKLGRDETSMIYLFHGSDTAKIRAKAFAWVSAAQAKAPDAIYVRLDAETLSEEALLDALKAQGLFFSRSLILLDDPFAKAEHADLVLRHLEALASSENPVAILAPKLLAARAKKLEAHAAKVFKIDAAEKVKRGFNAALVNALAARKGLELWKEIVKAEREGDVPEMIHGLLHWKVRQLMEKGGRGWTQEEARRMSVRLIEVVSESRSGDLHLAQALERFALKLK